MFAYFQSRAGRLVALVLGMLALTAVGTAQTQLRGPPLNQRPAGTQLIDPVTNKVIQVVPRTDFALMPPSPPPRPLNNGSLGDFPVGTNNFVFGFPPQQSGGGGGFGGGIGGGGFSGGFGGGGFSGGFGGGGFSGGFGGGGFSGGFGGGGFSGGFGGGGIGGGGFGGFGGFSRGDPTGGFSGFGGAGFGGFSGGF